MKRRASEHFAGARDDVRIDYYGLEPDLRFNIYQTLNWAAQIYAEIKTYKIYTEAKLYHKLIKFMNTIYPEKFVKKIANELYSDRIKPWVQMQTGEPLEQYKANELNFLVHVALYGLGSILN